LIKTTHPSSIRRKILKLQQQVLANSYYNGVPSVEKRRNHFAFHAKEDLPEIREKFFTLIKQLNIKAYIIVARKVEAIFHNKHNNKPDVFYNAMITHLFKNQFSEQ
jgi:hypothetical protein